MSEVIEPKGIMVRAIASCIRGGMNLEKSNKPCTNLKY